MKTYKYTIPELSLKLNKSEMIKSKITSSGEAAKICSQFYFDDLEIYESFFILLLNRANNTIGWAKISQGGCVGTVIDSKIIAKYCIDSLAQGVILCHNHPSGNNQQSNEDIEITKRIKQVLQLFDCNVLDHIILTSENYYSLADNGLIN